MAKSVRVRRVLLFMPGDDRRKIEKGAGLDVDCVIMDLEDGVAINRKSEARGVVLEALQTVDFRGSERLVRLNPADSGFQADDIAGVVAGLPDGLVLPKVESAVDIQRVSDALGDAEHHAGLEPGTIRLLAIIETALGVVNLREIAGADERLDALMFGAEDLAGSIGAARSQEGSEVFYVRSAVVLHAAAFGLQAIDTPFVDLSDTDRLRRETEQIMRMGYTGKMAIHPAQVPVIADVFTPSDEEIDRARAMIDAHDAHQAAGTGVFAFEGKMVDMPMIRAAERVIARARAAGKPD